MRTFPTGATRDDDETKPDFIGYNSPLVVRRYGEYMLKHQRQADGGMRPADNWKAGIPRDAYLSSLARHFLDLWLAHECGEAESREGIEEALCAILFNAQGYLHEVLKERRGDIDPKMYARPHAPGTETLGEALLRIHGGSNG